MSTTNKDPLASPSTINPLDCPPGGTSTHKGQALKERVSDFTSQAREKASQLGRSAADTIDRNIDSAAGALQSTASSLRNQGASGGETVSRLANRTADKLESTARYFEGHHTRDMMHDVERAVRKNPGISMAAALAVGVLLGSALRRDRS